MALGYLVLEVADVGALGAELGVAFALLDELGRLLDLADGACYSGLVLAVRAVVAGDGAKELVNLGRRVLAEHVDGPALVFGRSERVGATAVEALGGEDKLCVFEVVSELDRSGDGLDGLLEFTLDGAVWQDRNSDVHHLVIVRVNTGSRLV